MAHIDLLFTEGCLFIEEGYNWPTKRISIVPSVELFIKGWNRADTRLYRLLCRNTERCDLTVLTLISFGKDIRARSLFTSHALLNTYTNIKSTTTRFIF